MRTADEIVALYEDRRKKLAPIHARALGVRNAAYGEIILPVPERDAAEAPAVANTILVGLDQQSKRAASVLPALVYPALKPHIDKSKELARRRRSTNLWWWERNRFSLLILKRAMQFTAYAMSPVVVLHDPRKNYPCWHHRDAIGAFPPPQQPNEVVPDDCIFLCREPYGELRKNYPQQMERIAKPRNCPDDELFDVLEYVDAEQHCRIVIGKSNTFDYQPSGAKAVVLVQAPNIAERPLAVVPGRISLDQPRGQFDGLVPLYQMQSKLQALELMAMERAVFPETWLSAVSADQTPEIVRMADPITGQIGVVRNGRIETVSIAPNVFNNVHIDRLERAQRIEGGIPAEYGGESPSNVRTARRGGQILSAAVDFQIMAIHNAFEISLEEENRIAIALDKAARKGKTISFVSRTQGEIKYKPEELWETDYHVVKYAFAGVDAENLPVVGGQRVGMGTMSKERLMEIDPMIDDVELEKDRIVYEGLELAVLQGLQTFAASDPGALPLVADVAERVLSNKQGLIQATLAAQKALQEKQQQAAEGELPPVEAQPGMAEPVPAIAEQPQGLQNLAFLLQSLGAR